MVARKGPSANSHPGVQSATALSCCLSLVAKELAGTYLSRHLPEPWSVAWAAFVNEPEASN